MGIEERPDDERGEVTSANAQTLPAVPGTLHAQQHGVDTMARGRTVTAMCKVT